MPKSTPAVTPAARKRRRRFTLAEADRALPLVSRVVADVADAHAAARVLHGRREGRLPRDERSAVEADLRRAVDRLESLAAELADIGCELTDYAAGTVEFPARHDGREVVLCWRPGEGRVGHWRDPDGIAAQGRQPVGTLDEGLPL